jgi:hypothetical protein
MSGGPTSTGETCIEVTKRGRVNIDLRVKDWCAYRFECEATEITTQEHTICWHCIYRRRFDIPEMIEKAKKEKLNGNS